MAGEELAPSILEGVLWKQSPATLRFGKYQQRHVKLAYGRLTYCVPTAEGFPGERRGEVCFCSNQADIVLDEDSDTLFSLKPFYGWTSGEFTGSDSSRNFLFDAADSVHSRDKWVEAFNEHLKWGQKNSFSVAAANSLDEASGGGYPSGVVASGNTEGKTLYMLHIGTNNWQRQGEFAPGSGILHASMHQTFNSMPGVKCYSIYPSKMQTDPEYEEYADTVRIFKLTHDIPICESVSPNSSYRWHTMTDEEFEAYRKRLEDEVCAFMDEIEKKEQCEFDFLVSHHAFTNAMAGAQIMERRRKDGKKLCHYNFVHGTALKMYIKEKEKDEEYPERFLPIAQKHSVFQGRDATQGVWVNSEDYVSKFLDCFPEYPKDYCVFSRIGVNTDIFSPKGTGVGDLTKHVRDEDKERLNGIKRTVVFVGKFADWKRLDSVLHAAKIYEEEFPDLGTVIVGSGPPEAVTQYEDLAKSLDLKRAFFLGSQGQDVLAELFSMSEVGVFPSYKEPFGMVFIESMGCGCPVIGAKSGGPMEFVTEDVGCLIDEEDDWKSETGAQKLGERLAATIKQALDEDWKGKTKGPNCVQLVKDRFSTTTQCNLMLDDMKSWRWQETSVVK